MKCDEIIKKLESLSPASFAEEWDNVGLLAGRRDKEVSTVYIALDATDEVVKEAVRLGADLLLTHHPLIFKKMGRITTEDFIGRRLVELLRNDISYYAMHTNFDVMGMAEAAADYLELQDRQVLCVTYEKNFDKKDFDAETRFKEGFGRVGRLGKSMTVAEFAAFVKLRFDVPNVRVYGSLEDRVELAAVMPGSGGSFIRDVINAGAKVMEWRRALRLLMQGTMALRSSLLLIWRSLSRERCRSLRSVWQRSKSLLWWCRKEKSRWG